MRNIEVVKAELEAARDARKSFEVSLQDKIAEFKKTLYAENKGTSDMLDNRAMALAREYDETLAAVTSHPFEGRDVILTVTKDKFTYSGRKIIGQTTTIFYGKVVVIRDWNDYPPRPGRSSRDYDSLGTGDVIIQRYNAKGEKLSSFHHCWNDGLPNGWEVVEEKAA